MLNILSVVDSEHARCRVQTNTFVLRALGTCTASVGNKAEGVKPGLWPNSTDGQAAA